MPFSFYYDLYHLSFRLKMVMLNIQLTVKKLFLCNFNEMKVAALFVSLQI
jgi:hypothetical protein